MIRSNDSLDINSGFNGDVIDSKDVPWWTSCRLRLAILGFFGFVNLYALRVNLSVAIVCMVNGTAVHLKSETPPVETNSSVSWNQHFDSSCGRISSDNDTSVTRKFQGAVFPAMHTMWGKWAPPLERSKLTAFTYAGSQAGIVLTFPISSLLCKYGFAGGWPSIFYTLGLVSIIWVVLWMLLTSDSPEQHKGISTIEKQYILQSLRKTTRQGNTMDLNVPWRSIFTSMPVYAIVLSNFASDWGGYTFLTNIPSYMKEVLKLDITSNGFYSALPYIGFWCVVNGAGVLADFTQKYLTTTMTRKIFEFSGKVMPALLLIGLGYLDCTMKSLAIALLTLGVSFSAFQYSGFLINHMDIAPAYAGILFGISNSCGAISGFISPAAVGLITEKHQSRSEWQKVFFIAAAVYLFSAFFYLIFGKGEPQNWAVEDTTLEMEELNTKIEKRDNYEE
ncbi:sialin-like isoform X2 [Ostrea edulis]|uniref:sialin-like isoform X2 n=1 Tax=Ostrea edulis TaxID=37623 RepID=UPI0024AF2A06|nr:sialin-like isoform X2 [Ostrea edulis]